MPTTATVTDALRQEHQRLDRMLADVRAPLATGETERADFGAAELDAALRRHIRVEESVLFPVFDQRAGIVGPTQVMSREHRRIEQLLDSLRGELAAARLPPAQRLLEELAAVLAEHHRKEELVLYPKTDAALNADERRALVTRLRAR